MRRFIAEAFVAWEKKAPCVSNQSAFEAGWKACARYTPPETPQEDIPYKDIAAATNTVLGKNLSLTDSFKVLIRARWNEGMRLNNFVKVCEIKKLQWEHNPDMKHCLRPETLFGTKMNSYNNEDSTKAALEEWQ